MPRLTWSRSFPDVPRDFTAHDGDAYVGRIYRIDGGPRSGQWFWVMGGQIHGLWRNLVGYASSKDDAVRAVEEAYFEALER